MPLNINEIHLNEETTCARSTARRGGLTHAKTDETVPIIADDAEPGLKAQASLAVLETGQAVTNQGLLLERLRLKIEEKQKEFDELKNSEQLSKEEQMDFNRAHQRMMRPYDLAQSELLRQYPEAFTNYINNLLNNVLTLDAKQLNMLLACTHIQTAQGFESTFTCVDAYNGLTEEEKISKILPDFVDGEFKYLSGTPIVLRLSKQPKSYFFEFCKPVPKVRRDGLTKKDIEKIDGAFCFISQMELKKEKEKLFSSTESIVIISKGNFHGRAGSEHIPVIEVNDTRTSKEIMSTVVHEDRHQTQFYSDERYETIFNFELGNNDVKEISSPWGAKTPRSILAELEAYNAGNYALLEVFEKEGFDPEKDFHSLGNLIYDMADKLKAVEILSENTNMMNDEGLTLLQEETEKCRNFDIRLSAFLKGHIVQYLDSSDTGYRVGAFKSIDEASQKLFFSKDLAGICPQKIITEDVPCVLILLNKKDASADLKKAALKRFSSPKFQAIFLTTISHCFADDRFKLAGFGYISDGYEFLQSEGKKSYFKKLFKQKLQKENDLDILNKVVSYPIHIDLKLLAEVRIKSIKQPA